MAHHKNQFAPGVIDTGAALGSGNGCHCFAIAAVLTVLATAIACALAGYLSAPPTPLPLAACAAERFAAQGNQAQVGQHRFTCTLNHDR